MDAEEIKKITFSISEVARFIGVSRATVGSWLNRDLIPHIELPGNGKGKYRFIRIRKSDLDDFLKKHYHKPPKTVHEEKPYSSLILLPRMKDS